MSSKIYELSDNEFIELVKSSCNISEVLFKLKLSVKGNTWGYNQVKQRMKELDLNQGNFRGQKNLFIKNQQLSISDDVLFSEDCTHPRNILRRRLLKLNLIPYKCDICGIDKWRGKQISLELDHINGINNDNRIENLRFLCPNCHSQTSTYGSKNSKIQKIFNVNKNYNLGQEDIDSILALYEKYKNQKLVCKNSNYTKGVIKFVVDNYAEVASNQKYVIRYDKDRNEIMRWGSITEACKYLIENNEVKTERVKTCRATFLRNYNRFWLNSFWELVDSRKAL